MHEKIKDIQNSLWRAYSEFKKTLDMKKYNKDVQDLVKRYRYDPSMLEFCQGLIYEWSKVINKIKEWN